MAESRRVVVIGGGPAGIAAAGSAAEAGARVTLIDEGPGPGGQIWRRGPAGIPASARAWIERIDRSGVEVRGETTVVDVVDRRDVITVSRRGVERLTADRLVLATGAQELFLPFPGWTLPGVTGAGGLQALVKSGWPVAGRRIVVAGSGPLLLAVAALAREAGAEIIALVEQASRISVASLAPALLTRPSKARQAARFARRLTGVQKLFSAWPVRVEGDGAVSRVVVRHRDAERSFDCDVLACGFGLVADTRIARYLGCDTQEDAVPVGDGQETSVDGVFAAGEITGIAGVDAALAEGRIAGLRAAGADAPSRLVRASRRERRFGASLARAHELRSELGDLAEPDTIVCRCEDVSRGQLRGHTDLRDAKLGTRCGMGPCQGRVCGATLRFLEGWSEDRVRPPFFPVTAEELAALHEAPRSKR